MNSRRRLIVALAAGAFAVSLTAFAQERRRLWRIGILWDSPAVLPDAIEAFRQGLRDLRE